MLQARVFVACAQSSTCLIYVTMYNFIVFKRFSVDSRKRTKTVVWMQIDRMEKDYPFEHEQVSQ